MFEREWRWRTLIWKHLFKSVQPPENYIFHKVTSLGQHTWLWKKPKLQSTFKPLSFSWPIAANVVAGSGHHLHAGIMSLLGKEQKFAEARYKKTSFGVWDCNFLELLKLEGLLSFQTQQGSLNFPVSAMGSEGCSPRDTWSRVTQCPKCHLKFRLLLSLCGHYILMDHFPARRLPYM